jgi:hypothetical protein
MLFVEDRTDQIATRVRGYVAKGLPDEHRSKQVAQYRDRIAALDASAQIDPLQLRQQWGSEKSKEET